MSGGNPTGARKTSSSPHASATPTEKEVTEATDLFLQELLTRSRSKTGLTVWLRWLIQEAAPKLSADERQNALALLTSDKWDGVGEKLTKSFDESNFKTMSPQQHKQFLIAALNAVVCMYDSCQETDHACAKAAINKLISKYCCKNPDAPIWTFGKDTWGKDQRKDVVAQLEKGIDDRVKIFSSSREMSKYWALCMVMCICTTSIVVELVIMVKSGSFEPLPLGVVSLVMCACGSGIGQQYTMAMMCLIGGLWWQARVMTEKNLDEMSVIAATDFYTVQTVIRVLPTSGAKKDPDADKEEVMCVTKTKKKLRDMFVFHVLGCRCTNWKNALDAGMGLAVVCCMLGQCGK